MGSLLQKQMHYFSIRRQPFELKYTNRIEMNVDKDISQNPNVEIAAIHILNKDISFLTEYRAGKTINSPRQPNSMFPLMKTHPTATERIGIYWLSNH